MVTYSPESPIIFVVSRQEARASVLESALPSVRFKHISNTDSLLHETNTLPPDVVILYTDAPGAPLPQVISVLQKRAELSKTQWLGVGSQGLGSLLAAGVDALISDTTGTDAILIQVRNMLRRTQRHKELQDRIAKLQNRIDDLEHDERVRDQLVHMLVHDLKNPISAIMGLLDVVQSDSAVPEDSRELVRISRDEAQHLLHLAVNMLDVRKIQAGKMNLRRELIFSPMLTEIIELACGDIGSGLKDRQMNIQVAKDLSPVSADPNILRRMMANLISNAQKHTTSGGKIIIKIVSRFEEVIISVHDNGEGIPAEDIPNLFAAFEQSRLTLHGRFDTGLGLAFCKMAVEEHGGRIWVESERGHGANFYFTLPSTSDEDEGYEDDDFFEILS